MIESKRSHFTLFLLFPLAYLCADARFSTEPSLTPPPWPSPPPSSSSSSSAFHGSDLSFRIKVAALLCTFLFISIFSFYLNNWAASLLIDQENRTSAGVLGGGGGDDGRRRSLSRGIGREIIDTFPILVYSTIKNLKIGKGDLECAVCLSEFKDYETLRLIPKCNHVFHPECIDAWLASHATCPVCRANLNAENSGEVVADDGVPPPSPSTPLNADELVEENTQDNSGISETQAVSNGSESTINSRSDDADGSTMDDEAKAKRNRISRRPRWRMFGKLARSNSTGHSLVQNNTERHTLRLPEDVRRYILLNHSTIVGRCASYNVMMPMKGMGWSDSEGSSKGKRNYVERQDRWVLSATPPFVHRKD